MATVTYGGGVSELKGSVGGVTFQRNKSGTIVKRKTYYPNNPGSVQSTNQNYLAKIVSSWQGLSSARRAQWDVIAAAHDHTTPWGDTKTLSGFQFFMSNNLNLLATGQAIYVDQPTWLAPAAPDQFTLETDVDGIYIRWDPEYNPPYNFLLISVSPPLRQGNILLRRSLFQIDIYGAGQTGEIDITADYIAQFGMTWATFWAAAECFIIARVRLIAEDEGWSSAYVSAITQIT